MYSESNADSICTVDPYKFLHNSPNPDGTITRHDLFPSVPATTATTATVVTKDIPLNHHHSTILRLFLPRSAISNDASLPIIVYFHGGGFALHHADSELFHNFCAILAEDAVALVASVDYRLAPEHRLPAAYDDAVEAIQWIKTHHRESDWLSQYGDISNCFLMGDSAGANIAYNAGLRLAATPDEFQPLIIKGLILDQPYFGGSDRTRSELDLVNDEYLPLSANDLFWEFSLPVGVNRDHEYCNPVTRSESGQLEKLKESGWRVVVTGCSGDPLFDRQVEVVKVMREKGVKVVGEFSEGDHHGKVVMDPTHPIKAKPFIELVKNFIRSNF